MDEAILRCCIPIPLIGKALWIHLGDVAKHLHAEHGEYPVSRDESTLKADVRRFAQAAFGIPTIAWGDVHKRRRSHVRYRQHRVQSVCLDSVLEPYAHLELRSKVFLWGVTVDPALFLFPVHRDLTVKNSTQD